MEYHKFSEKWPGRHSGVTPEISVAERPEDGVMSWCCRTSIPWFMAITIYSNGATHGGHIHQSGTSTLSGRHELRILLILHQQIDNIRFLKMVNWDETLKAKSRHPKAFIVCNRTLKCDMQMTLHSVNKYRLNSSINVVMATVFAASHSNERNLSFNIHLTLF